MTTIFYGKGQTDYRRYLEWINASITINQSYRIGERTMFGEMNKKGNQFDFVPENKDLFMGTIEYFDKILEGEDDDHKESKVVPCYGFFFFDTVNGDSGAMILPECNVYIPKHLLDTFRKIGDNPEQVQAVKDGKLGVSFHKYDSKKRKNCVGVNLVDITS